MRDTKLHETGVKAPLRDFLVDALRKCLAQGMAPPLIACVVAVNAGVQVFRFSLGEDGELLKQLLIERLPNADDGMLQMPINILIVDQRGEATRVVFGENDEMMFH
jgi:hypothetical protein